MPFRMLALCAAVALVAGCEQNPNAPSHSSSPLRPDTASSTPATTGGGSTSMPTQVQGGTERVVSMMDACDPDTFNAAIGPGTCVRSGGVPFDNFIAQLQKHQSIGAWHFAPGSTTAKVGQTFLAINRGGEEHTFTEVAEYGGGIVPTLNQLSGNTTVAPECLALEADDHVPAGGTYREHLNESGVKKFQCCIHPWMRLEARVTEK